VLSSKGKVDKAMKALSEEGFEASARMGPELTLAEGQPIIVRFRGNISDADGRPVNFSKLSVFRSSIAKVDFSSFLICNID